MQQAIIRKLDLRKGCGQAVICKSGLWVHLPWGSLRQVSTVMEVGQVIYVTVDRQKRVGTIWAEPPLF